MFLLYGCFVRNIKQVIKEFSTKLPRNEIRILLSYYLNISQEKLLLSEDQELSALQNKELRELLQRRINFEPISYITGCREFYGLAFYVDNSVMIPRPETELIVDEVLKICSNNLITKKEINLLDLCTGSACIAISSVINSININALALDISSGALGVAEKNAKYHDCSDRVSFHISNYFSYFDQENSTHKFDIITCNPPYIAAGDKLVSNETRIYEPPLALYADDDGFFPYYVLSNKAHYYLNAGGFLIVEVGIGMANKVEKIISSSKLVHLKTKNDLASIPRCLVFQKT